MAFLFKKVILNMRKRVIIVGTSHVAEQSIDNVRHVIENEKPDCVAIELCVNRYRALVSKKKASFSGDPFFFAMHLLQQELGKSAGILPGSEMLEAIKSAQENNAKVAFVDKDISEIVYGLKKISFFTKMKLLGESLIGAFSSGIDLKTVPSDRDIDQAIRELKKSYPEFYRVLVKERNDFMVERIKILKKNYNKIVVVVGAGHKKEMEKMLKRKVRKKIVKRKKR
jgi:pheromone shutdown-related protein TraB